MAKRKSPANRSIPVGYHHAWPIDKLTPHPRNPRRGDVRAITESLLTNGFYGAVVVQSSTGHVLAGNHTLAAAMQQHAQSLPIYAIDVDDGGAIAIMLADNRLADSGSYDQVALATLLDQIDKEMHSFAGTGFAAADAERIITKALGEQRVAETDEKDAADGDADNEDGIQIWRLVVQCSSEQAQLTLLERLARAGFEPRAGIA